MHVPVRTLCLQWGRPRQGRPRRGRPHGGRCVHTGTSFLGHHVHVQTLCPQRGRPRRGRPRRGSYVLNGDVLNGDIMSSMGTSLSRKSWTGTSSAGTSCPHRDVLNGDIYVHFYFCPFVGILCVVVTLSFNAKMDLANFECNLMTRDSQKWPCKVVGM